MSRDNAEPGLNGCQIIQVPSAMQQIYHHKSLTWRTKSIISRFDQLWKSLLWISTAPPKFNWPLKNGGWKTTFLFWEGNFSAAMLNFGGVNHNSAVNVWKFQNDKLSWIPKKCSFLPLNFHLSFLTFCLWRLVTFWVEDFGIASSHFLVLQSDLVRIYKWTLEKGPSDL